MPDPDPPTIERLDPAQNLYRVKLPNQNYRSVFNPARQGEVAMIVSRCPGWVLLQSKAHYPAGVFRLPTGRISSEESAEQVLVRELHEEANLAPGSYSRLFRLYYGVDGQRDDFFTEAFWVEHPLGVLHPNDATEAITAWREAAIADLPQVAKELRSMEGTWTGWGLFRSVVHQLAAQVLQEAGSGAPPRS